MEQYVEREESYKSYREKGNESREEKLKERRVKERGQGNKLREHIEGENSSTEWLQKV